MGELPQELVVEILLRLPVKSLLRFRCVSKSLFEHMDTPYFINSHLSKSSQNLNKLIFLDPWKKYVVYDANVDLDGESILLGKPVSSSRWMSLVGYCKGLLLLCRGYRFGFSIWNPSTRQLRDLPDGPVSSSINGSGLGYDHSIDEYKVVCIVGVSMPMPYGPDQRLDEVWIYGLKSNIWRRSQNLPYSNCILRGPADLEGMGVFTDGSLHWICEHTLDDIWQLDIMSFDVQKETFSLVPQPFCSIKKSMERVLSSLHVLEGCLCIRYCNRDHMPPKAELYMRRMKDGVHKFTWMKLYSLREPNLHYMFKINIMKVLSYSKRRDKILLHLNRHGMVWYDLRKKIFGKVEKNNHVNWPNCPIICSESLVSLGGGAEHI